MSKLKLYPYQQNALNSVINSFQNKRIHGQLLVMPTGSGKTILLSEKDEFGLIKTYWENIYPSLNK